MRVSGSPVNFRNEALGAFAHEFRTPLTAIKMVMELGRRAGQGEDIHLDPEIAEMLDESVRNLETLADGIQALSWLERGKLKLDDGPCDLAASIAAARVSLGETVAVTTAGADGVTGPWDPARLPGAIAALIETAARCGTGEVAITASAADGATSLTVASGEPGGNPRALNADLGFDFFAACLLLQYGDANIICERSTRYFKVTVELPA